ncbi:MAG: ATP-binding cassette domain-containing protein, partial [Mesorhizobium sp.]
MIEARNVSVAIGGKRIVANVDFDVRSGEIAAIVGPNGSGKTTLLRALSGDLAHSGEVTINGRDLSAMKPVEAATMRAVLPQATTLSFPFTVREIVRLGLLGGRSGALPGEDER